MSIVTGKGRLTGFAAPIAFPSSPAPITPASAILEPADRSAPPVRITSVIPIEAIPYKAIVLRILSMLLIVINSGFKAVNPTNIATMSIKIRIC